ncbi:MAG: deoxyribonuclease IV [Acidobacteriota bacterium]
MIDSNPLLGAHMSIAGGTPLAVERASRLGCRVLQIFVRNCNQWKGKPLLDEEVENFRNAWARSQIQEVVAHDSYLINLASPENELRRRSIGALLDELDRSERLGLSYLVVHPGSHRGEGKKEGIKRIAQAIDQIHEKTWDWSVRIALETTAGQGTSIGYRFEHMRDIMACCRYPERVFVCMDTCHIFAAGYDIRQRDEYSKTMEEFDRVVDLKKLKIFHFNDSKKDLGSRVDRHDHIGQGKIGISGFQWILNDRRFTEIPKILETPKGKTHRQDRRNLKVLRSLVGR